MRRQKEVYPTYICIGYELSPFPLFSVNIILSITIQINGKDKNQQMAIKRNGKIELLIQIKLINFIDLFQFFNQMKLIFQSLLFNFHRLQSHQLEEKHNKMRRLQVIDHQMAVDPNAIRQIQTSQYQQEDQSWIIAHIYCLYGNHVLKVEFNHMYYNALDATKTYIRKKQTIIKHFQRHSQVLTIDLDRFWIQKLNSLPDRKYQFVGSPTVNPKRIIQDFYNVWNKVFYVPIDMSHLTGEACLLNYTLNMNLTFEDNWNQIKKIKKNQKNFLFEKDKLGNAKWKEYLNTQKAWVSIINNPYFEDKFCGQRFSYDQNFLQGLVVIINKQDFRWTFSFFADPKMMDYFISKYNLREVQFG